jgi:hypothetical protein
MYTEKQKFRQAWLLLLLIVPVLAVISTFSFGFYKQIILGQPFGDKPMSDSGLIVTYSLVLVVLGGLIALFLFAELTTQIDREGVHYRFFPFHFKFHLIPREMIEKAEVVTYKPLRDYGGWGIRFGSKGKAYNVRGDKGLQLSLQNGRQILFGTQNERELEIFLKTWK